mmetsp:Transcript_139365/g.445711  ORF Transcript_139365/g.445711 Transcript_139365/m.445711 type:complete len:200 (+) Transcript_139365:45-644(+)
MRRHVRYEALQKEAESKPHVGYLKPIAAHTCAVVSLLHWHATQPQPRGSGHTFAAHQLPLTSWLCHSLMPLPPALVLAQVLSLEVAGVLRASHAATCNSCSCTCPASQRRCTSPRRASTSPSSFRRAAPLLPPSPPPGGREALPWPRPRPRQPPRGPRGHSWHHARHRPAPQRLAPPRPPPPRQSIGRCRRRRASGQAP